MLALLALGSSVVWGSSDFLAGLLSRRMPPATVVALSHAIGFVALSVAIAVGLGGPLTWEGWPLWAVGAGVCGGLGLLCLYAALAEGPMGVVAPITSLSVLVPVAFGIARGDHAPVIVWVGVALAILGVVLASGPELGGAVTVRALVLAVLAALLLGGSFVCLDGGGRHSVVHTLWGMRGTSAAGYALAAVILRRGPGPVAARDWWPLTLVGLGDLLANALFVVASTRGMISVASVLGSLYPVVTVLWAWVVLRERLRPIQIAGVAVAMVGVAFIALR
ncbi:DMT family transporter [Actinomycetota bacterium]